MEANRRAAFFGLLNRCTVSCHPANSSSDRITTLPFPPWRVTRSGARSSVTRSNQVARLRRRSVKDTWATGGCSRKVCTGLCTVAASAGKYFREPDDGNGADRRGRPASKPGPEWPDVFNSRFQISQHITREFKDG